MTAKHTPGPWSTYRSTDICTDSGHVASAENVADARLIAAAPDLLEALKQMVRWNGERCDEDDTLLPEEKQCPEVQDAMRAIAKAEGK